MAAAEGMDLGLAADIAASAIRGFGMEATEAGRVADVLAKTSAASNSSIASLGEALKYVAPYAKAVGLNIEQTNAMLTKKIQDMELRIHGKQKYLQNEAKEK